MFLQSLRMTWRDWRAGELHFLLLALVVAVASLSAVSFFVDRMQSALGQDAHELLGGDLVIVADQKPEDAWFSEAEKRGLLHAETLGFVSMASTLHEDAPSSRLVSVKAVSETYPLKGKLKTAARPDGPSEVTAGIPEAGTVWVDVSILRLLDIACGDRIELGGVSFTVSRILLFEPDRGISLVNFAPRVMLARKDLDKTALVQPASRISWRLLLAGPPEAIEAYRKWAEKKIESEANRGIRIETLENARPEMNRTLERGRQFLALVGLLSAMLAAVAIAMAARRFVLRHLDACAMLRCLGMTQNEVSLLYLTEFLLLGLAGSVLGAAIGFAAHFVLLEILGSLVPKAIPPAGWLPFFKSIATGLVLLAGFAMPPILQLRNVSHNRVIRREKETPQALTLVAGLAAFAGFFALLFWQAGDLKLGGYTAGGFVGGILAFFLSGWLCLKGIKALRMRITSPRWRFMLAALERRPATTLIQMTALASGLMALLLLTVVRADLLREWKKATPPDTPNHFIINILPGQEQGLIQLMAERGLERPQLFPMVRGRLLSVNDKGVQEMAFRDPQSKRMVLREFNLSYMDTLPRENPIVRGQAFSGIGNEISMEIEMAKRLDLSIGDRLVFDVAGTRVAAVVSSFRKVDWGSIRVNFFAIMNPESLREQPQTGITAFYLPKGKEGFSGDLTRAFPNMTLIDVGSMITRIQAILEQVILAVEFLVLFTLFSGFLVLYAALVGSQDERMREASLLRALGATRSQLKQAQRFEFFLTGSVAGLLAASAADLTGWILATQVFSFSWTFNPLVWLAGLVAGALCALAGGWFGLRHILNHPPLATLREE